MDAVMLLSLFPEYFGEIGFLIIKPINPVRARILKELMFRSTWRFVLFDNFKKGFV
jgi:hypothetical protein